MANSCSTSVCGTGGWNGPLPGDPDNNSVLSVVSEFGGVRVSWTLPNTNSYAVAHTRLFRSIDTEFATAIPLTVAAGTEYFDTSAAVVIRRYYYWIQHVSINGTMLDPIGPVSAIAKPLIDQVLADLAGKLEATALAESLRGRIDRIASLETGLTQLSTSVSTENGVLIQELAGLRTELTEAMAYVDQQTTLNSSQQQALVASLNTQVAQINNSLYAAIQEEATTRAEETGELFAQKILKFDLAGNISGVGLSASVDPQGNADSQFMVRANSFTLAAPSVAQATAPENPYDGMVWVDTSVTPNQTKWYDKASQAWQATPGKRTSPFTYLTTPTVVDGYTLEPGLYIDSAVISRLKSNQIDVLGLAVRDATTGNVTFKITNNGNVTMAGELDGANGTFKGALVGATGTFNGTLAAGILDSSAFDGMAYEYPNPGAFSIPVPQLKTGWTGIAMRVTLQAAGGGGGGSYSSGAPNRNPVASGGGGGAGTRNVYTITSVTPGTMLTLTVGEGGNGGAGSNVWNNGNLVTASAGTNGGNTSLTFGTTTLSVAGGTAGGPGNSSPTAGSAGGLGGQAGTAGSNISAPGGNGGSSFYGSGGTGGQAGYDWASNGSNGGRGAGGGGGGADVQADHGVVANGGKGGNGYALIEFYDPNLVVRQAAFQEYKDARAAWELTVNNRLAGIPSNVVDTINSIVNSALAAHTAYYSHVHYTD